MRHGDRFERLAGLQHEERLRPAAGARRGDWPSGPGRGSVIGPRESPGASGDRPPTGEPGRWTTCMSPGARSVGAPRAREAASGLPNLQRSRSAPREREPRGSAASQKLRGEASSADTALRARTSFARARKARRFWRAERRFFATATCSRRPRAPVVHGPRLGDDRRTTTVRRRGKYERPATTDERRRRGPTVPARPARRQTAAGGSRLLDPLSVPSSCQFGLFLRRGTRARPLDSAGTAPFCSA